MLLKNLPLCAFYSVEAVSVRPSNNIAGFLSPLNICNSIRQTLICNGQSIECGFTLKRVRDMTRTYSQMHRTDKNSEHSSII